jgi:hypothetical protein
VQVNGTSVLSNGVANVPIGGTDILGVVKSGGVIYIDENGQLRQNVAGIVQVKAGTNAGLPIVPNHQHESVFYGMAKAAGDSTQSSSSNAVGTYTDAAKVAIRTMLGATSSNVIEVSDT